MKQKVDWNLKFLREIFGLECLHFGYWEKGEELNLENLKNLSKDILRNYSQLFLKV